MTHKTISITIITLILCIASGFKLNDSRELTIISKVFGLEPVQKILKDQNLQIVTNGLIDKTVNLSYNDREIPLYISNDSFSNKGKVLTIKKFDINERNATVKIVGEKTKIKVKLSNDIDEWTIKSYYVKNNKDISISREF